MIQAKVEDNVKIRIKAQELCLSCPQSLIVNHDLISECVIISIFICYLYRYVKKPANIFTCECSIFRTIKNKSASLHENDTIYFWNDVLEALSDEDDART